MTLITVIGRGHSGTRAMSHLLSASGVFMGEPLNKSGDLLPPQSLYDACRLFSPYVDWLGDLEWSWDRAFEAEIPTEFHSLVETYLTTVLASDEPHRGWKLPETTLVFPWITRIFPDIRYIFWIRDPRDCILGHHLTDDLADFNIPYPETEDIYLRRAISWKYQYDLVRTCPKPNNWIEVRLEDFVQNQPVTLARLEKYLGFPMTPIPVIPEAVGRWRREENPPLFDFFEPALTEYGYDLL